MRQRGRVRRRGCRARGTRRRRSPGCRAGRRTRTSRCRADRGSPLGGDPPLVRDHLRRAGLAADVMALDPRTAAGAAAVDDPPHPVADRLQLLRGDVHVRLRRRRRHRLHPGPVVHRLDEVRRDARAAVGERRGVDRHGHRRDCHLPLADGHRNGLARVPLRFSSASSSTRSRARGPTSSFGRSMLDFTPRPNSVAHLLIRSTPSMLPTV